ncbi:MAG: SDR family oxidoreductase [Candidatus Sericytochromatia bacterium]|nr:SDR family oxidoreductase [Candidatus Tanganyikabacteria bacterium]
MSALQEAYRGKRILLVGASGFLGGVALSLLLSRCPELERAYVLMRRAPGLPAPERFAERVLPAVAFDPLRAAWPEINDRVTVLQGDMSAPDLGLEPDALEALGDLDLILNCAGLVDFEAPLDQAYRTNVVGVQNLVALARRTGAHLIHVSTCFVAGAATGRRAEEVEAGWFPRRDEAPYLDFDPAREIADIEAEIGRLGKAVEEQAAQASYRERALERFRSLNAGLPSPAALANAARRVQRDDLRDRLVEAGRKRANFWGWSNVYTYSKSIGEQVLAAADDLRWSLVRPAIIESALRYPEPGYNLNATTSAPLVMLALNGFQLAPARPDLVLDIVPVDTVAAGILAVGAAAVRGRAGQVYQIGTSDANPCRGDRVIELIGLYIHERELGKGKGVLHANREPVIVSREAFEGRTRRGQALWRTLADRAEALRGSVDHPALRAILGKAAARAATVAEDLDKARAFWDLFLPFTHDYDYRFVSAHIRDLWAELGEPYDLRELDWRTYWLDVHIPGLRRHVLTESFGKTIKPVATPMSLAERVEAVARDDAYRAAFTAPGGRSLTYGELWARAGQIAGSLRERPQGEVGVDLDPEGWWLAALLGAQRAGRVARLSGPGTARKGGPRIAAAADGFALLAGRRRESISYQNARTDGLGASDAPGAPGIAMGDREPIAARDLARSLERLAGWLACEPGAVVVVSADAPPVALLAPLHAQAELRLVPDEAVPGAIADGGATAVVACAAVPDRPYRLRALVDASPLSGTARLEACKLPVTQILADGLLLAAHREVTRPADRDAPFEAESGVSWPDMPWRVRVSDDRPDRVFLDGLAGEATSLGALRARLADQPGVAAATVHGGAGTTLAFLRPDPAAFRDFRQMVARLGGVLRETNSAIPAAQRLHALIVTFGDLPEPGDDTWEARTDWIRLSPRSERAEWAGMPDDRIPLFDLEEEDVRLARGRLADPADLAFVLDHHREATLTYERLLVLERVLLALFRRAEPFNAQAFLQRHGDEAARTARLEYRVGFRLGTIVQKWRDWHASEDPEGTLLPAAVTEPVKAGLAMATDAFFDHAMDVSVRGKAYIPVAGAYVVVANHSSHLDTGVVKYALGAWGERIRALAAKDYFFGTPARRFLAHHFTRLIPTERQAVTTEWVKRAREALGEGDWVLIFPEGTRTADPEVQPFKASLGTLLRACRAPVLPVYVHGTHEILPKGTLLPRGRKIRVFVGPPIPYAHLEQVTAAAAGTLARDRLMADYVRDAVAGLERGDFFWLRDRALPAGGRDE